MSILTNDDILRIIERVEAERRPSRLNTSAQAAATGTAASTAGAIGNVFRLAQSATVGTERLGRGLASGVVGAVEKASGFVEDPVGSTVAPPTPGGGAGAAMLRDVGPTGPQLVATKLGDVAEPLKAVETGIRGIEGATNPKAVDPYTPEWFSSQIAGALPQMMVSVAGAVAGGAVGGPPGAVVGGLSPTFLLEAGQVASDVYEEKRRQGSSDLDAAAEAMIPALAAGAINAGIEYGGVQKLLTTGAAKRFTRKWIGQVLTATATEGVEEAAQGAVSEGTTAAATGTEIQPGFVGRRLNEAAVGAVVGAGVSPIAATIGARAPTSPDLSTDAVRAEGTPAPVAPSDTTPSTEAPAGVSSVSETGATPTPAPNPTTPTERYGVAASIASRQIRPMIEDGTIDGPDARAITQEVARQFRGADTPITDDAVSAVVQRVVQDRSQNARQVPVDAPQSIDPEGAPQTPTTTTEAATPPATPEQEPDTAPAPAAPASIFQTEKAAREAAEEGQDVVPVLGGAAWAVVSRETTAPKTTPAKPTVTDRLKAIADEADARIIARQKKRGSTLFANPIPNPRDLIDPAISIAARALRAGIIGGRELSRFVAQNVPKHLKDHAGRIRRIVGGIVRDSVGKDGKIDEDAFERAVGDVLDVSTREESPKAAIHRTAGPRAKTPEGEAVKSRVRNAARAAREAYALGVREQREVGQRRIDALRTRSIEAIKNVRAAKDRQADNVKAKAAAAEGLREELRTIINEHLPVRLRGELINDVARATTLGRVAIGIAKVRRALEAERRRQAIADYRKLTKRLKPDKLAPQFRDALKAKLGNLGVSRTSEARKRRLAAMLNYAASSPASALPPWMISRASAALNAKSVRDMPIQELENLNLAIAHILHLNRTLNKLRFGRAAREFAATKDDAVAAVKGAKPLNTRAMHRIASMFMRGDPRADARKSLVGRYLEEQLDRETLGFVMDNGQEGGVWWKVLYDNFHQGTNTSLRHQHAGRDALHAALRRAGLEPGSKRLKRWSTARIKTTIGTREVELTRPERIELALLIRDEETAPQLHSAGFKLDSARSKPRIPIKYPDQVAFLQSLTPEEKAVADGMSRYVNGRLKRSANRVWVNTVGFEALTNPTYWHRRRDMTETQKAAPEGLRRYASAFLENLGIFKERTEAGSPFLVGDAFSTYQKVVLETSEFIGKAQPIRTMAMVIGNPEVDHAIRASLGVQRVNTLQTLLDEASILGEHESDTMSQFVGRLSGNVAKGVLGLNPQTALKQPGGVFVMAAFIDPKSLAKGVKAAASANPIGTWKKIRRWSPLLRDRYEGSMTRLVLPEFGNAHPMTGVPGFIQTIRDSKGVSLLNPYFWRDHGLHLMQWGDFLNAAVAWHAADAELDPSIKGAERNRRIAYRAESLVASTQNPSNTLDMNTFTLRSKKNALARLVVVFQSFSAKMLNAAVRSHVRAVRDASPAGWSRHAMRLGAIGLGATVWAMLVEEFIGAILATEEDRARMDEDGGGMAEGLAWKGVTDAADTLPGFGKAVRVASYMIQNDDTFSRYAAQRGMNPVESTFMDLIAAMSEMFKASAAFKDEDTDTDKMLKSAGSALEQAAILSGVPVRYVRMIYEKVKDELTR